MRSAAEALEMVPSLKQEGGVGVDEDDVVGAEVDEEDVEDTEVDEGDVAGAEVDVVMGLLDAEVDVDFTVAADVTLKLEMEVTETVVVTGLPVSR